LYATIIILSWCGEWL